MGRGERIRRALAAREDHLVRALFSTATTANTTTTNAAPSEPLTLDKIGRLACDLRAEFGPTPMFLSSKLFPFDKALTVESATERFVCAHPSFWLRLQHEVGRDQSPPDLIANPIRPMFGIQVLEIDIEDDTPEDRKRYLRGVWARLMDAFKVAMVPLPDWLRKP